MPSGRRAEMRALREVGDLASIPLDLVAALGWERGDEVVVELVDQERRQSKAT